MTVNSEKLSPQEIEALVLLAQGYNDNQIAKQMKYDVDTIRHYFFCIRRKLGYPRYANKDFGAMRVRLAMYAVETGLHKPKTEQYSLPSRTHIVEMRYRYVIGNRVQITNKEHTLYGKHGIIKSLMPYTFKYPAYDVEFGDVTAALSESSLERN